MNELKINTVGKLVNGLQNFDKQLPVAIFDRDCGYMSVAFKKEITKKNEIEFQWLSFYAHETIQMYTIETLLGYLSKLPEQAAILKKTEEDKFTPLYLSIEGMRENGNYYQWLVISDELEYDRFFRKFDVKINEKINENEMEKALEKMLLEVKRETSESIERVHQYLCKQTDLTLFTGILTEGKTIKSAMNYCSEKARELVKNEQFAMIEDETVFEWIKEYFISYELPKPKEKKKPVNKVKGQSLKSANTEKVRDEQQIELFVTA